MAQKPVKKLDGEKLSDDELRARIKELLRQGRKPEAVKLQMEQRGGGLRVAKDAVDALQKTL